MSRILTGTFVIATSLFASNTFARAQGCGCGTSRPPLRCGTVVSVECAPAEPATHRLVAAWSSVLVAPPAAPAFRQLTTVRPSATGVSLATAVTTRAKLSLRTEMATPGGSVRENVAGSVNGAGSVSGTGSVSGGGTVNGAGSDNGKGRLDPDVLTGSPQDLQSFNTERIWTDSSGVHKRLARFVRIEGTQVILLNAQGRTTRVEVQNLSTEDQLFLDQLRQTSMKRAFPSNQQHSVASRS